jgi:hypothetical protein
MACASFCHPVPRFLEKEVKENLTIDYLLNCLGILFGAAILSVPLLVCHLGYPNASIQGVPLSGLFVWLEICWAALWIIYYGVKQLARVPHWLCLLCRQEQYCSLMLRLKRSLTFLLLAITAWGSISRICYSDRQLCARANWIRILTTTMRSTIIVAAIFVVEQLVMELILISIVSQFLEPRLKRIVWEIDILLNIAEWEEDSCSSVGPSDDGAAENCSSMGCINSCQAKMSSGEDRFKDLVKGIFGKALSPGKDRFNDLVKDIFAEALDEEYTKEAWEEVNARMPSERRSPLETKITERIFSRVWNRLAPPDMRRIVSIEVRIDDNPSKNESQNYIWTETFKARLMEVALRMKKTHWRKRPEPMISLNRRVVDIVSDIIDDTNDDKINPDELGSFIKDLIHRFLSCKRALVDAERNVRDLNYILTFFALIGSGVIYGV